MAAAWLYDKDKGLMSVIELENGSFYAATLSPLLPPPVATVHIDVCN